MKYHHFFGKNTLVTLGLWLVASPLWADSGWSYRQEHDSLSNQNYSVAQSPLPRPGVYDDMMLAIICKSNKLQAQIEADDLISSQGSNFTLDYQIDKLAPITLTLKTFPDSKRKGYTDVAAQQLADDLLTGQAVFIRINTMLRTVLSSPISLDNAAASIKQVLADCAVSANKTAGETAYGLAEFQQALSQLTSEQQQHVWAKIKVLMQEMP